VTLAGAAADAQHVGPHQSTPIPALSTAHWLDICDTIPQKIPAGSKQQDRNKNVKATMSETPDITTTYRLLDAAPVDHLLAALSHPVWSVRTKAISKLARSNDPRVIPAIIAALDDREGRVREIAIMALGYLRAKDAIPSLLQLFPQVAYTYITARALGDIGGDRAMTCLLDALRDPQPLMRLSAATALGFTGDKRLIDPLTLALSDERSEVREAVAFALEKLTNDQAVELTDDDSSESDPELDVVPPF